MEVEQWDAVLHDPKPAWAMRRAVECLASEGHSKAEIIESLGRYLDVIRDRPGHTEEDDDFVMESLDALFGWCHPSARLLPD